MSRSFATGLAAVILTAATPVLAQMPLDPAQRG